MGKCKNCGFETDTNFCPNCGMSMRQEMPKRRVEAEDCSGKDQKVSQDTPNQPNNINPQAQLHYYGYQRNVNANIGSGQNSYGPKAPKNTDKDKLTAKTWWVILWLIIFWPLGLFFMWKNRKWPTAVRIVITVVIGILIVIGISVPWFVSKTDSTTSTVGVDVKIEDPAIVLVDQSVVGDEYGFWTTKFTIRNNTDITINTVTIRIKELDKDGNIVSTTYPQDPVSIEAGQSIVLEGIHQDDLGIASVKVVGYSYYEGETTDGVYKEGVLKDSEELLLQ